MVAGKQCLGSLLLQVAGGEEGDAGAPGTAGEQGEATVPAEVTGRPGSPPLAAADEGDSDDTPDPSDAEGVSGEESASDGPPSNSCSGADEAALEPGSQEDQPRRVATRNRPGTRGRVQPFDVPKTGQFWLHDDRFAAEEEGQPARRREPAREARARAAVLASAAAKPADAADVDVDGEDRCVRFFFLTMHTGKVNVFWG